MKQLASVESASFLLTGVASEYVLAPLAEALRTRGKDVTEIDFGKADARWIELAPAKRPLVLITSAHPFVTAAWATRYLPIYAQQYAHVPSPLEMIGLLRPDVTVLVPHDLVSPITESPLNEFLFLPAFDFYCEPRPPSPYAGWRGSCKILPTGWVKTLAAHKALPDIVERPVLLLPSMIEHLRLKYGVEGFVDYFRPLLGPTVSIKLPAWHGIESLEAEFRKCRDVQVVPSDTPLIPLMRLHEVVVSNGTSSVLAEAAALGRPAIALLDTEGFGSVEAQLRGLPNQPALMKHNYTTRAPINRWRASNSLPAEMSSFDVELLLGAIQTKLEQGNL